MTDTAVKTPLSDLVASALDAMRRGGAMRVMDIPDDSSYSSHTFSGEVSQEISRRANLAAVPAQVRVKPLVWTGDGHWHSGDNEGWMEEVNTPFGWGYAVEFGTLDTGPWKVSSTFGSDIVGFNTPSAAKAAAQADYEARILAAIEPQPYPRDEVIARLVEAAESAVSCFQYQMMQGFSKHPMAQAGIDQLSAALAAAKAVQHG